MCDENTFAAAYRSDLRDEIVETLTRLKTKRWKIKDAATMPRHEIK